jgi:hypothetical protein
MFHVKQNGEPGQARHLGWMSFLTYAANFYAGLSSYE